MQSGRTESGAPRFVTLFRPLIPLATAPLAALLASALALPGCSACGTTQGILRVRDTEFYVWKWQQSGGTLSIKGEVASSPNDVERLVHKAPAEPCPTPEEAVAFRNATAPKPGEVYRSIRPGSGAFPTLNSFDCDYIYDDDYCEADR